MKTRPLIALALLFTVGSFPSAACAADQKKPAFADKFDRNESQEVKDDVGNGWSTNSEKETKGMSRQFDLKDGALHVFRYPGTKHSASMIRPTDFQDGSFEMKFKLDHEEDSFEVTVIDPQFAGSKNGMLFDFAVRPNELAFTEHKTGSSSTAAREATKAGTLSPDQQAAFKSKNKTFPLKIETGKWHTVLATIKGETLNLSIDGQAAGTFTSPGVAHPQKGRIRLEFPGHATIDDVNITAVSP